MGKNTTKTNSDFKIALLFVFGLLLMIVLNLITISIFENQIANEMLLNSISRIVGGSVFLIVIYMIGYKKLIMANSPLLQSLLIIIPGLLVALNNFPILAFFEGRAGLTEPVYTIFIFLIECISVSYFEEIIFRVILLVLLLKELPNTRQGMYFAIFISSAFFGILHVVNLFSGANFTDTILQVGYSFLMGLMWAVVYLKTKNIWMSILLHSSYNFFGLVLFKLGYVDGRFDNITLIITILLAILVAVYMFLISLKIDVVKLKNFTE